MNTAQEPKTRVLVVDDDPAVLETTSALLSDTYDVVKAIDGEQALKQLSLQPVDVVCTDLNMPRMNGLELIKRVRQLPGKIACLLVTGHAEYLDRAERNPSELFLMLIRPYEPQKLLELVARADRFHRMQKAVGAVGTALDMGKVPT